MGTYYTEIKVDTWKKARDIYLYISKVTNWAFRGQGDESWELETNFERNAKIYNSFHRKHNLDYERKERFIVESFKRKAHFYLKALPENDNLVEWLSLIQHYGGPTRLLDFSYSFYVAAFFAMERSTSNCAIWAINLDLLSEAVEQLANPEIKQYLYDKEGYFDTLLFSNYILSNNFSDKGVCYTTPFRMHERLSIQQGLFLLPCSLSDSFIDNLVQTFSLLGYDNKPESYKIGLDDKFEYHILSQCPLLKIVIPESSQNSALEELRNMNISASTLFPGVDGFARSLNMIFRNDVFDGEFDRVFRGHRD